MLLGKSPGLFFFCKLCMFSVTVCVGISDCNMSVIEFGFLHECDTVWIFHIKGIRMYRPDTKHVSVNCT